MQTAVKIQEANPAHVEAVVALWLELMAYHERTDRRFMLRDRAAELFRAYALQYIEQDDAHLWIALAGEEVIGYVTARVDSIPPVYLVDRCVLLEDQYVTGAWRSRGIGERLTREVLAWAERDGYDHVQLQVAAFNERAHAFWRRMGFRDLSIIMRHELGLHREDEG